MTLTRAMVYAACLLAASASVRGDVPCSETLKFAADGAINRWTVCHRGVQQSFGESGDGRLRIHFLVNGQPLEEDLQWQRSGKQDGIASFYALGLRRSLEIRRTYDKNTDASLTHTVSIRNLAGRPVSVGVAMETGGALHSRSGTRRSLADFVYGFQRAEVETEQDGWQAASDGSVSKRFAISSRHKSLVIDAGQPFIVHAGRTSSEISSGPAGEWQLVWETQSVAPGQTRTFRQEVSALPTETGILAAAGYGGLIYADLWPPLAALSRWIERILTALSALAWGPAFAVVLLAVAIRLVTMPVSFWSARRQREFVLVSERMKPQIEAVREKFKGAEQSERILSIYKENGVSPFSGLKGSVGLFVQIPFLLAVFNVTTASALFAGESFLWISDLSLPDTLAILPAAIPLLGSHLNALPIALGVVNVFSLKKGRGEQVASTSNLTSAIVTLLIVFLFYSFAAAVVLYWLTVNLLQAGERLVFRRIGGRAGGEDE